MLCRHRGFSLVEIIIAMSIFVVFFLAVLETWPLSQKAVAQARNVVAATQIGQQQMELALLPGQQVVHHRLQRGRHYGDDDQQAQRGVAVAAVHLHRLGPRGQHLSPKDIYVQVKWSEGGARGRSVQRALQFETLLAQPK